jgi:hypothetical protein
MKRELLVVTALLLLAGCAALGGMAEKEKIYEKSVPVITASFASKQAPGGENWLVYINASDPDGDMDQIFCSVDFQAGIDHPYPISITKVKSDQGRNLSGYLHLGTPELDRPINLTLRLQIRDKAGHFSAPVSFEVNIIDQSRKKEKVGQESPPPGVFQDKDLGRIMIVLTTEVG